MDIDTSCFRAFKSAAETLNFTEASRLIGMTQSGVSQHISKLEKDLDAALFHRVGKKVHLTAAGKKLLHFVETYHDSVRALREDIQNEKLSLAGKVRYAMPTSCLLSPHFSMLLKDKKKEYPHVELEVSLADSSEIIEMLFNHSIDFGFVTKKFLNDELEYLDFCREEYVFVSSRAQKEEDVLASKWIHYPDSDLLVETWMSKQGKQVKKISTQLQGKSNSIYVALAMVAHGLGVAVFPRHCVETSEYRNRLRIHDFGKESCQNTIFIVSLRSVRHPKRVLRVIEAFREMKV